MSSGGGKAPSNTTNTTTTIPKYAEPYAMEMLGRTQALMQTPYQQYQDQRVAGFNPLQQQAMNNVAGMQTSPYTQQAAGMTGLAALRAADMAGSYQPYAGGNFYNPADYAGMDVSYRDVNAPTWEAAQMGNVGGVGAGNVSAGPVNYYQMDNVKDVDSDKWNQQAADEYMSPYMQSVVERQQRDAIRQADIAATKRGFQAATSGAFGSTRQALGDYEAQRSLGDQLGMIQAKGLQDAWTQGQQQFNTDQGRALQAALANQQTQFGVGRENLGANLGVQGLKFQGDLQAALANQSTGLQAGIANQNAGLQAMLANMQAKNQAAQSNAQMAMQAGQLNQAAQLQAQQQALAQNQFMNSFNQNNALNSANFGLQGAQLGEQSRQFGAGFGLDALRQATAGAGQLGQLGTDMYNQNMGIYQAQRDAGAQQQALEQQLLSTNYQDFLDRLNYPYKQMGFFSDLIHGLPTNQSTTVFGYPNTAAQTAGTLGGLGSLYLAGKGGG